MIDRDLLRACIAYEDGELIDRPDVPDTTTYILEAAHLVADPNTLIISKVDGEWPNWAMLALDNAEKSAYGRGASAPLLSDYLDALLEGQPK